MHESRKEDEKDSKDTSLFDDYPEDLKYPPDLDVKEVMVDGKLQRVGKYAFKVWDDGRAIFSPGKQKGSTFFELTNALQTVKYCESQVNLNMKRLFPKNKARGLDEKIYLGSSSCTETLNSVMKTAVPDGVSEYVSELYIMEHAGKHNTNMIRKSSNKWDVDHHKGWLVNEVNEIARNMSFEFGTHELGHIQAPIADNGETFCATYLAGLESEEKKRNLLVEQVRLEEISSRIQVEFQPAPRPVENTPEIQYITESSNYMAPRDTPTALKRHVDGLRAYAHSQSTEFCTKYALTVKDRSKMGHKTYVLCDQNSHKKWSRSGFCKCDCGNSKKSQSHTSMSCPRKIALELRKRHKKFTEGRIAHATLERPHAVGLQKYV